IPYKSTKAHIINFKCSFFIDGEEKFLIKSVKEKGLLKIDYLSYNESIYYDIKNKIFDSKEVEINLLRNDENYYEYQIHDWKLSIVLEKIKEKYFMSFFYLPERTEFFKLMLDDWKDN
ncbi:MAG: hypothetical protein NZM09_02620, partial [Ignavibacterium sp.]|nr:hypothetical protein [Ignavibacterium sp.]MDW8374569.1 hypothetical protein [Ignavibacteriales bacterium]